MRKLLILLCIGCLTWGTSAQDTTVTATAYGTTNIRSGPDTQYPIVGRLTAGETVPVTGRDQTIARWLRVTLPDTTEGWVATFMVEVSGDLTTVPVLTTDGDLPTEPDPTAAVTVVAYGRVNVRSGPAITFDVVGQLDIDDQAEALARSNRANDWLYIENDTVTGWVAYFTVAVSGDPDALPLRVPEPENGELVAPSDLIRANFTIRLRAEPTLRADVRGEIPFNSRAAPLARTSDAVWLYVTFEDLEGWGQTRLFSINRDQLDMLPVFVLPDPETTPEATAEAGADD